MKKIKGNFEELIQKACNVYTKTEKKDKKKIAKTKVSNKKNK